MKNNKKLIGISILLIGILTLSIVTVNLIKSRGNSDTEWINFAIEDTTKITKIIIEGFNEKVDTKFQYAEHFLTCIALHPDTPDSIRDTIKGVDSKVIQQAIAVSSRRVV